MPSPASPFPSSVGTQSYNFSTFIDATDLNGQQGWTLDGASEPSLFIQGNEAHSQTTAQCGNVVAITIPAWNITQPWSLTATARFTPAADAGGNINILLGDITAANVMMTIVFVAGDGVLQQFTSVNLNDASGSASAGPGAFPTSVGVVLLLRNTGTALQGWINGVLFASIPTPDFTAIANTIGLILAANDVMDTFTFSNVTLTQ